MDSQSAPSCFGPREIAYVSSGNSRGEELSLIGHHGDCATNAMRKMIADDAVGRSNKLTLLRRCLLMVVVGRRMIKATLLGQYGWAVQPEMAARQRGFGGQ